MVDTTSLNGLRGVAAVWVMIFHCVVYSAFPVDLQGSSIMPLFFVLSGFSMQLAYGDYFSNDDDGDCCCGNSKDDDRYSRFIQNRLARTYPVYFMTTLFAVPLWWAGYYGAGTVYGFATSAVASLLLLSTAVCFVFGVPLDGPGWTVCTLFIMWLFFPYSARRARAMSVPELRRWLVFNYYLQLFLVFAVFVPLFLLTGWGVAFAGATMLPWTRYPAFLLGVYAGELCLRHDNSSTGSSSNSAVEEEGSSLLPWPSAALCLFPSWEGCCCCCCVGAGGSSFWVLHGFGGAATVRGSEMEEAGVDDKAHWARHADKASLAVLALTLATAVGDAAYMLATADPSNNIFGGLWLQAVVPFLQVSVVVGLARDADGLSRAARFLRLPLLQWLGKISMSLYLVHHPVIYYTVWGHNCLARGLCGRPIHVPTEWDCKAKYGGDDDGDDGDDGKLAQCKHELHDYERTLVVPFWCIPIVVAVSILLAALLYYAVEEPGRRLLRAPKSSSAQAKKKLPPATTGGSCESRTLGTALLTESI